MSHRVNLENGKVTVTGDADGHPVVLEGNIKDVSLNVERDFDDVDFDSLRYSLLSRERYSLEFQRNDEGVAYTIKYKPITVTHSARVEATDRTVEAFEKAREQAGAPKNAKVRVGDFQSLSNELTVTPLAKAQPIMVEFTWEERK
jgi:hypothetical protein